MATEDDDPASDHAIREAIGRYDISVPAGHHRANGDYPHTIRTIAADNHAILTGIDADGEKASIPSRIAGYLIAKYHRWTGNGEYGARIAVSQKCRPGRPQYKNAVTVWMPMANGIEI